MESGSGQDFVHGNKGNDKLTTDEGGDRIWGEKGNDRITPGADVDTVFGGKGNDRIFARDGATRDKVDCGKGQDVAIVDDEDKVKNNCETVQRR